MSRTKFGKRRKQAYLDALRQGARRGAAAASVGVTRETVRLHRQKDPEFAQAEIDAELEAHELVEDALFQAALSGNVVACQVWLYNRMPDRWQDRRNVNLQHTGKDGGPIEIRDVRERLLGKLVPEATTGETAGGARGAD